MKQKLEMKNLGLEQKVSLNFRNIYLKTYSYLPILTIYFSEFYLLTQLCLGNRNLHFKIFLNVQRCLLNENISKRDF